MKIITTGLITVILLNTTVGCSSKKVSTKSTASSYATSQNDRSDSKSPSKKQNSTSTSKGTDLTPLIGLMVLGAGVAYVSAVAKGTKEMFTPPSSSSMNEYQRTHPPCQSSDTCYSVTSTDSSRRYKITCTRGNDTGKQGDICANSNGMWASGCSVTDTFAHHHSSVDKAARRFCNL